MKTRIALSTLALTLAFGALVAPGASQAEITTEQRQLAAFSAIELSGPYDVVVRAQGKNGMSISGERKDLAAVETSIKGETLIVRAPSRNGFYFSFGKRDRIRITINAESLKSLSMSGSGDVQLEQLSADQFRINASGPGDLRASGAVRELVLGSSGSGDVDLHQFKAANVKLNMSGPGDVKLAGISGELEARISGPGDLEADALHAQRVRVQIHGPGNADLRGETQTLFADLNGPGDLNGEHLQVKNATVRSDGPGDVELATVSDTLDAELHGPGGLASALRGKRLLLKISGPGDADISGTVDSVSADISGPGNLEAGRLLAIQADVRVHGPGNATLKVKNDGSDNARLMSFDRRGSH